MKKVILKNGIRIYQEYSNKLPIVAIDIFIKGGSRYEPKGERGESYLIDSLVMRCIDDSENVNITTYKEFSVYSIVGRDDDYKKKLADVYKAMSGEKWYEVFEKEKRLMLEHIKEKDRYDIDSYFESLIFAEQGLGNSVCGEYEDAEKFTLESIEDKRIQNFSGKNIFVIISGNANDEDIVYTCRLFSRFPCGIEKNSGTTVSLCGLNVIDDNSEAVDVKMAINLEKIPRNEASVFANVMQKRLSFASVYSNIFTDKRMLIIEYLAHSDSVVKKLESSIKKIQEVISVTEAEVALQKFKNKILDAGRNPSDFNFEFGWEIALEQRPSLSIEEKMAMIEKLTLEKLNTYRNEFVNYKNINILLVGGISKTEKSIISSWWKE